MNFECIFTTIKFSGFINKIALDMKMCTYFRSLEEESINSEKVVRCFLYYSTTIMIAPNGDI